MATNAQLEYYCYLCSLLDIDIDPDVEGMTTKETSLLIDELKEMLKELE